MQILCILLSAKNKSTLKESNGVKYFTLVVTDESKDKLCYVKNYGKKIEILLDQKPIAQMIMIKNV